MTVHWDKDRGSLIVVGTGIRIVGQLTIEAIAWMKSAEKLLFDVADEFAEDILQRLNPTGAESLKRFYEAGKPRLDTYKEMVNYTLAHVRAGKRTCLAVYGHPGVFTFPTNEAIRMAKAENYTARMIPGISAEDCLFADMRIDPGSHGCQSFEATYFLTHKLSIDPSSVLILWQIGVVGQRVYPPSGHDFAALPLLVERLSDHYPPDQLCELYWAPTLFGLEAEVHPIALSELAKSNIPPGATLCIRPTRPPARDEAMIRRLNDPLS
jgi:hypothetical protein